MFNLIRGLLVFCAVFFASAIHDPSSTDTTEQIAAPALNLQEAGSEDVCDFLDDNIYRLDLEFSDENLNREGFTIIRYDDGRSYMRCEPGSSLFVLSQIAKTNEPVTPYRLLFERGDKKLVPVLRASIDDKEVFVPVIGDKPELALCVLKHEDVVTGIKQLMISSPDRKFSEIGTEREDMEDPFVVKGHEWSGEKIAIRFYPSSPFTMRSAHEHGGLPIR